MNVFLSGKFLLMAVESPCGLFSDTCDNSCMTCWVKDLSLLNELSFEELEILNEKRGTYFYKAGDVIYKEDDHALGLYCLHSGKVKIVKSGLSNNPIVALKKPVNFFGLKSLMLEKPHSTTAVALEPCTVCIIDRENFLKIVKGNSDLSFKVMKLLSENLEYANKRMVGLTQKHLRARLTDALLMLMEQYGTISDNKTLDIQLKRADLAALANMTPANAMRILSDFSREGLIEVDRRKIKILKIDQLQEISQLG